MVNDLDTAETVVINTCAFIEEAQQESIDAILEVVGRKGKGVEKVLVAGCMVNRFGDQLAREIPEIDGFVGLDQLRDVGRRGAARRRPAAAGALAHGLRPHRAAPAHHPRATPT